MIRRPQLKCRRKLISPKICTRTYVCPPSEINADIAGVSVIAHYNLFLTMWPISTERDLEAPSSVSKRRLYSVKRSRSFHSYFAAVQTTEKTEKSIGNRVLFMCTQRKKYNCVIFKAYTSVKTIVDVSVLLLYLECALDNLTDSENGFDLKKKIVLI